MCIESQLIEKFMNGDKKAFEKLVLLFDKRIYNYCYRMTNNPIDAEDLAQEVFIKVYKNLNGFRNDSRFSTWIYRIAHNICVDKYRKEKIKTVPLNLDKLSDKVRDISSPLPLPEEEIITKEGYSIIKECIAQLKPQYRSAIILRDIEDYTYKEISQILNIPIGTVKTHINRGRNLLQRALVARHRLDDGEGI